MYDPSTMAKSAPLEPEMDSFSLLEGFEDLYDPSSLFLLLNLDRFEAASDSKDDRMDELDQLLMDKEFITDCSRRESNHSEEQTNHSEMSSSYDSSRVDFLLDGMEYMYDPWLAPGSSSSPLSQKRRAVNRFPTSQSLFSTIYSDEQFISTHDTCDQEMK